MRSARIVLLLTLSNCCHAADNLPVPKPAKSLSELQAQIEQILMETRTPGAAVAIVHRASPEWVAGMGHADVETGRVVTPETLFQVGQTSAVFVSLAILKLIDQGKLTLDTRIRDVVPEIWYENRWEETNPVRVVNLLEHTTGWDDLHLRDYAKDGSGMSLGDALEFAHSSRVSRWPPSTRLAYCNSGPAVAAYIVERLTGKRFEDYVRQNFFLPIGMKTATYFQPATQDMVIPYHRNGETPFRYRNFIYRPAAGLSASAKDMAALLRFYLNRGSVGDSELVTAGDMDRMENPTSDWADQEGVKCGYGLGNDCSQRGGFSYHGHKGQVEGGLTEFSYLSEYEVGYFYSINSGNGIAFERIGMAIRAYITAGLPIPKVSPNTSIPANAEDYAGWYVSDSPQVEATRFLEQVFRLTWVRFRNGKMIISDFRESATFLPVGDEQFRDVPENGPPEPMASAILLKRKEGGIFIQAGTIYTLKRIPTWLVAGQIVLLGIVVLILVSVVPIAVFSMSHGLVRRHKRPAERAMMFSPLIAMLSLYSFLAIFYMCREDRIELLGNLTLWSVGLWFASVLFALASLVSVWMVRQMWSKEAGREVRIYAVLVAAALLVTTAFLAYWNVIGLRTWA